MKTRFDGHTPGSRAVYVKNVELAEAAPDLLRVACQLAEALESEIMSHNHIGDNAEQTLTAFHALVDEAKP